MIAQPIRGRDAGTRLARALDTAAEAADLSVSIEVGATRPWASATFGGTQLTLTLASPRAPTLGRWLSDLPLAELPMRGFLLASLAVDGLEDDGAIVRATLTALVIDG